MTRIRYSQVKTNTILLVSNDSILLPDGNLVKIYLDTQANTYQFVNVDNGQTLANGSSNSLINLKKLVRESLLTLGVPFEKEVRKRNTEEAA